MSCTGISCCILLIFHSLILMYLIPLGIFNFDCSDSSSGEGGGLRDTPIEVVHLLLSHLLSASQGDLLGVSADQKAAFFKTLTKG
jgi:hypothetical protein